MSNIDKHLDEFEKAEKIGNIVSDIVASTGLTSGILSLISLTTGIINSPQNLLFLAGGTVLISPFTYLGMKKLKNKMDERVERDMHQAGQIFLMFEDVLKPDFKITKTTALFLNQILDKLEKEQLQLQKDDYMHINQLLYLINSNYYEEIIKTHKNMTREQLIDKILNQIISYLRKNDKDTFDEKDAKIVLDSCFFLEDELKKEIAEEFKKSKVTVASTTTYEIIRKDLPDSSVKSYKAKRAEEQEERNASRFDIYSERDYHTLIQNFSSSEEILKLGNPNELEWNMDLLIKIIQTIGLNYRDELLENNASHNNLNLAASYIYNLISYALVNKRKEVGYKEMIATFKNWNYLPFSIKLKALDDIFEQEQISYEEHPFKISASKKQPQKVIEFKPKSE